MKTWKRIVAYSLTLALLTGLLTGLNVKENDGLLNRANADASSDIVIGEDGKFRIPASTGELGTIDNPFVVLEIVPNESMAQIGYLVDGQEPIDLDKLADRVNELKSKDEKDLSDAEKEELTKLTTLQDALKDYVQVKLGDPVMTKFGEDRTLEELDEYYWRQIEDSDRYGKYVLLTGDEAGTGDYDLKIEVVYKYVDAINGEGTGAYNKNETVKEVGENKGDYTYKLVPYTDEDAAEGVEVVWEKVEEGTGEYSSAKYVKGEPFSGEFSKEYKYVGDGKGNYSYKMPVFYTGNTEDKINEGTYIQYYYAPDWSQNEYVVKFVYKGNAAAKSEGLTTYKAVQMPYKNIYVEPLNWNTQSYIRYYSLNNGNYEYFGPYNSWLGMVTGDYHVIFVEDETGDYVVSDTVERTTDNKTTALRTYDLKYNWGFNKKNGLYNSLSGVSYDYTTLSASEKEGLPVKIGTGTIAGVTKGLGEYSLYNFEEHGEESYQIVDESKGDIGTKDYNKRKKELVYVGENKGDHTKEVTYDRAEENDGDTDKIVDKFIYKIIDNEGKGAYELVKYSYEESNNVTEPEKYRVDKAWEISWNEISDAEILAPLTDDEEEEKAILKKAEIPEEVLYRCGENLEAYNAYEGAGRVNTELFKKYALGLAYIDNDYSKGEDSTSYTFEGWFMEPECVNRFNTTSLLTQNTTLYAKWSVSYSDELEGSKFQVEFDMNAGEDDVESIPSVNKLMAGDKIVAPNKTPLRKGYLFAGWYTDEECTNAYMFGTPVTESFTLYAKWVELPEKTYTIHFAANTEVGFESTVTGMPADITGVGKNGRKNGAEDSFTSIEPVQPSREGYRFLGWYWNANCTNKFVFDAEIFDAAEADITLYARWAKEDAIPTVTVSFKSNEPANAVAKATGMPKSMKVPVGYSVDNDKLQAVKPQLAGNIAEKLANYHVKVITVTPKDLDANLGLIERANLIVLNENMGADGSVAKQAEALWKDYRKTDLFPKKAEDYNITATSFTGNDLSWAATEKILYKLVAMNGMSYCPVLFDYSVYQNVIKNGSTQKVTFKSKFSDGRNYGGTSEKGCNNNVYKLFLMTQQMNPVTLYNAYLKDSGNRKIDSAGNFTGGTSEDPDTKAYWNKYTLIPYNALSKAEWNSVTDTNTTALDVIGVTQKYELAAEQSGYKNRVALFNNSGSLLESFSKLIVENDASRVAEMNEYLYAAGGATPASYKMADVVYYLLHDSAVYQNFNKSLNIMEIEPVNGFKSDVFWFWYLSRYIPNFAGSYSVTQKSVLEFVGDISDLNAEYDVIYIGTDAKGLQTSVMPTSVGRQNVNAGQEVIVTKDQHISGGYSKWVDKGDTYTYITSDKYDKLSKREKSYYTEVYQHAIAGYDNASIAIQEWLLNKYDSGLGLKCEFNYLGQYKMFDAPDTIKYAIYVGENYYGYSIYNCYDKLEYSCINEPNIKVQVHVDENDWGHGYIFDTAKWKYVYFYLPTYYVKTVSNSGWVHYDGGDVKVGDKIKLDEAGVILTDSAETYVYAHTGKVISGSQSRGGLLGGDSDQIKEYAYSGNDITKVKYDALLAFADAGYPVVLSHSVFSGGVIDTSKIDTASYIYEFINAIANDPKYRDVCYVEDTLDAEHDKKFIEALKNKNFELIVTKKPIEYKDATKGSYDDKDIYVNGQDEKEKNLEFAFKIDGSSSETYEVRLYIDTNADGKFHEVDEKLDSLEIVDVATKKTVRYNRLQGGHSYEMTRIIDDYTGAIPWKLEVVSNSNSAVKDNMYGMCAIKVEEKTPIYVLQICSNTTSDSFKNNVYFPMATEIEAARSIKTQEINSSNMGTYFSGALKHADGTEITGNNIIENAGLFYYYTKDLKEFEVEFFRVTVDQFKEFANDGKLNTTNESLKRLKLVGNKIMLTGEVKDGKAADDIEVNMLILGYADCYSDIDDTKSLTLIQNFIESGKTTLFTHDTTSFINYQPTAFQNYKNAGKIDSNVHYWGYNINQYFRVMLGMDRYDVMTNHGDSSKLSTATDLPYEPGTLQSLENLEKSGGKVLTHGYTNVTISGDGDRPTKAIKTNDGQIVKYPYEIDSELTVASTHAQYYQLNLESDDTVVWYTLSSSSNDFYKAKDVRNNYYIYNKGNITYSGVGHSDNMSANEVKLFVNTMIAAYMAGTLPSKPVITNRDRTSDTSMDFLYVDYDATTSTDDVNYVADSVPFGAEIYKYSAEGTIIPAGDTTTPVAYYAKRVYFTLKNYSIVAKKKMTVHYYPVVTVIEDGKEKQIPLLEKPLKLTTYKEDDDGSEAIKTDEFDYTYSTVTGSKVTNKISGGLVESNFTYYVDIPLADSFYQSLQLDIDGTEEEKIRKQKVNEQLMKFAMDSNSSFRIQIQVIMRYGNEEAHNEPLVGDRDVVIMRRGMFSLD